jgi:hypothetical protein
LSEKLSEPGFGSFRDVNPLLVKSKKKIIFSVSNTEFEGGDDGHGLGDYTFLAKQAQPSHTLFNPLCLG